MKTPPWRGVLLGVAGCGKSTMAAAACAHGEKPGRVIAFDSPYNLDPYEMYGTVEETVGTVGQLVRRVHSRSGRLLIQLDCFWDEEPEKPHAFMDFWKVRPEIIEEVYAGHWGTVVTDTATGMRDMAFNQARYRDNPNTKEPRQWHGATKDYIASWTLGTMPGLPCSSILLMHCREYEYEEQVGREKVLRRKKELIAPGTLSVDIPSKPSEVYYLYTDHTGERWLQTRNRGHEGYDCCKSSPKVNAPDPCEPTWEAVWSNWRKEHGGQRDSDPRRNAEAAEGGGS